VRDVPVDILNTSPDTTADVKTLDIPLDILCLCDPWLRFLWDLRGSYLGTLIDFDSSDPLHFFGGEARGR